MSLILKLEDGIIKTFSLELETETVLIFPNCHPLLTIERWLRLGGWVVGETHDQ